MNGTNDFVELTGEALGTEGIDHLTKRAEAICLWERTRIELANEPALAAKRAAYGAALDEERGLKARLARTAPLPDGKSRRRRIAMCWIVATILVVSGFVLSLLTLEPYRLGLKAAFYCLGIAVVVPFLVEKALDVFASETLRNVMVAVSCLAGLASLIFLATIRGNLLAEQVRQQDSASAVIEGEEPQDTAPQNTFYGDTVPLLQLVMALLAFTMEIGAGIAVHEAERMSEAADGEYESLQRELREAQERLALLVQEVVALQNEAPGFVARFWRDFYWSLLKGALKKAAKHFILPALALFLLWPSALLAQQRLDLVIAVDLSKSVDRAGPDGQTAFAKNISAVTQLLDRLPAGARVTVIGIGEDSFLQPAILLTAEIPHDPGYFNERLAAARTAIVKAWLTRSKELAPTAKHTDIFGALLLAADLFGHGSGASERKLVLFSDMRQSSRTLNVEAVPRVPDFRQVRGRVSSEVADLKGVEVFVLGAEETNGSNAYWQALRGFWMDYFQAAEATVRRYSVLREALQ